MYDRSRNPGAVILSVLFLLALFGAGVKGCLEQSGVLAPDPSRGQRLELDRRSGDN